MRQLSGRLQPHPLTKLPPCGGAGTGSYAVVRYAVHKETRARVSGTFSYLTRPQNVVLPCFRRVWPWDAPIRDGSAALWANERAAPTQVAIKCVKVMNPATQKVLKDGRVRRVATLEL